MSGLVTPFLMQSAVQAITPILLASLAGVLCARVGVFNMALEGQMLVGAFAAIVGSYYTHSAAGGVAAAMVAAVVFSLILAYGATMFRGDAVVICIGMNLLALGLTAYLLRVMFGVSGTFADPAIVGLAKIRFSALQDVPILGWGFARQTPVTWAAWALVALVSLILFRTPLGLRLRGVGEQPDAAETLGVDVRLSGGDRTRLRRFCRPRRRAAFAWRGQRVRREYERRAWLDRRRGGDAGARQSALCRGGLRTVRPRGRVEHPFAEPGLAQSAHRHFALCGDARRAGHQPSPARAGAPLARGRARHARRRGRAAAGHALISAIPLEGADPWRNSAE
jgi:hypothetical protein